ncbi:hypothetical protein ACYCSE_17475 [Paenibacillus sp. SEL1]
MELEKGCWYRITWEAETYLNESLKPKERKIEVDEGHLLYNDRGRIWLRVSRGKHGIGKCTITKIEQLQLNNNKEKIVVKTTDGENKNFKRQPDTNILF